MMDLRAPNLQEQVREALLTFTEKNAVFKTKARADLPVRDNYL
jgi:hypothetical protein